MHAAARRALAACGEGRLRHGYGLRRENRDPAGPDTGEAVAGWNCGAAGRRAERRREEGSREGGGGREVKREGGRKEGGREGTRLAKPPMHSRRSHGGSASLWSVTVAGPTRRESSARRSTRSPSWGAARYDQRSDAAGYDQMRQDTIRCGRIRSDTSRHGTRGAARGRHPGARPDMTTCDQV